jgi:hypothetical protein
VTDRDVKLGSEKTVVAPESFQSLIYCLELILLNRLSTDIETGLLFRTKGRNPN